jgi:hypothetical protein
VPNHEGNIRCNVIRILTIENDPETAHVRFDTPGFPEPFRPHLLQEAVSYSPLDPLRYSVMVAGPYGEFEERSGGLPPKTRRMVFYDNYPNDNVADIPPEIAGHLFGLEGLLALQRSEQDFAELPPRWGSSGEHAVPPHRPAAAQASSPQAGRGGLGEDNDDFSSSSTRRVDLTGNPEITAMRIPTRRGTIQPVMLNEILRYSPNSTGRRLFYKAGIYAPEEPVERPELGGTFSVQVQYGDEADHQLWEMPAVLAALLIGPEGMLARLRTLGSYSPPE